MEKLELKEIVGYLPYGLKCEIEYDLKNHILELSGVVNEITVFNHSGERKQHNIYREINYIKPILRPLSDLTKEIEVDGVKFVPINKLLEDYNFDISKMDEEEILSYSESLVEIDMSLMTANRLYEWHFDIHNLINRGLAIDINTL